jgi:hypothetical protein
MDVFGGLLDDAFSDEALGLADPATEELNAEPTHEEAPVPAPAGETVAEATPAEAGLGAETAAVTPEAAPTDWKQQLEIADKRYRDNQAAFTRERAEKMQMQAQLAAAQAELQRMRDSVKAAAPGNKEDALKNFLENPDAFVNQAVAPLVNERVNSILKPLQEAAEKENAQRIYAAGMAEVFKSYPQVQADKDAQKQVVAEAVRISQAMGDDKAWTKDPAMFQLAAIKAFGMPKEVNQAAISAAEARGRQAALAEFAAKEAGKTGKTIITNNTMQTAEPVSEEDRIREEIASVSMGFGW